MCCLQCNSCGHHDVSGKTSHATPRTALHLGTPSGVSVLTEIMMRVASCYLTCILLIAHATPRTALRLGTASALHQGTASRLKDARQAHQRLVTIAKCQQRCCSGVGTISSDHIPVLKERGGHAGLSRVKTRSRLRNMKNPMITWDGT